MATPNPTKSGCANKHKAHRSTKKRGYYQNQYLRTNANKLRRKKTRLRRMAVRKLNHDAE